MTIKQSTVRKKGKTLAKNEKKLTKHLTVEGTVVMDKGAHIQGERETFRKDKK